MRKWTGLLLRNNHLWRCWGWLSLLDWIGSLTLSLLLKLPPKKMEPWFVLWSFFLLRLLCISINLPYSLAWKNVWAGAPSCYLELLDILQKQTCRPIGPTFATSLEPLAHHQNVASLSLFYSHYFGRCSSELAQLVPLPYSSGSSTRYSDRLHDFLWPFQDVTRIMSTISFHTGRLWNSLPVECFPLTFNLNG